MDKDKEYLRKGVVYREVQDEKAKRRGTGFLGFISELDWLMSLELEEGRPLDETKITTGIKISVFSTGFSTALMMHTFTLFGLTIAWIFFLWGLNDNPPKWLIIGGYLFVLFMGLAFKFIVPIWLVDTYYLYPKGVVYTYLEWFIWGFTLGVFLPELGYFFLQLIAEGIVFLLKGTDIYQKIYPYLERYAPQLLSPWWLLVDFLAVLLSFIPPIVLYLYKRYHPLGKYPWLPLDFIPEDSDEKELEKYLKKD